ncbi:MAG: NAD(P)-binding domain-containing protein, partial [Armatimonadetes bacterium]|nr:NAD(P)-binding domain-containing protein [Armatimonadota bacterium]
MLSERIAVLGVGAMGSALVRGWLANGVLSASQVTVFDLATERAAALAAELGVVTAATPAAAVAQAEVVLV